jgi:hypothetical protein
MKKIIILAATILLAIPASAGSRTMKDRTENWLQRENTEEITASGDLRRIGPVPEPPTVPIGDGIGYILVAAGIYGLCKRKKRFLPEI